jgi:NTP pyrophosphatase (non-canonical NTP hydrolase)
MKLDEYQKQALYFRLPTADALYALLNLSSEVGELQGLIAKTIRDGVNKETYPTELKKELGDVLWCLSAVCLDNGFSLEDVAQTNLNKLASRKAAGTIGGPSEARLDE